MLACVLALAAAVCYGVVFPGIEYKEQVFDIRICVILAAAGILAAVLLLAGERTAGFAPALLCLGSGVALMLFINIAIWPVSDTIYGIEPFPQITQLVVCARADCRRPGGGRDRALSEKVPARLTGTTRREEELP